MVSCLPGRRLTTLAVGLLHVRRRASLVARSQRVWFTVSLLVFIRIGHLV